MHDERGPVDDEPMLEALRSLPPIPPAPEVRDRLMATVASRAAAAPHADSAPASSQRSESTPLRAPGLARSLRRARWLAPLAAAAVVLLWLRPGPDTATPAPSGDSDAASSLQLLALDGGTAAALAAARRGLEEGASDPVRVLAVDALSRVASGPELEAVLVETARADPSPFVQASVLSASRSLDAEAGARVARALLSRGDLDDVLRREATQLDRPVSR